MEVLALPGPAPLRWACGISCPQSLPRTKPLPDLHEDLSTSVRSAICDSTPWRERLHSNVQNRQRALLQVQEELLNKASPNRHCAINLGSERGASAGLDASPTYWQQSRVSGCTRATSVTPFQSCLWYGWPLCHLPTKRVCNKKLRAAPRLCGAPSELPTWGFPWNNNLKGITANVWPRSFEPQSSSTSRLGWTTVEGWHLRSLMTNLDWTSMRRCPEARTTEGVLRCSGFKPIITRGNSGSHQQLCITPHMSAKRSAHTSSVCWRWSMDRLHSLVTVLMGGMAPLTTTLYHRLSANWLRRGSATFRRLSALFDARLPAASIDSAARGGGGGASSPPATAPACSSCLAGPCRRTRGSLRGLRQRQPRLLNLTDSLLNLSHFFPSLHSLSSIG